MSAGAATTNNPSIPSMLRVLRTRLALAAAALLVAVATAVHMLSAWQSEGPGQMAPIVSLCALPVVGLALLIGTACARRRGEPRFPGVGTLCKLVLLSALCICTGTLYITADPYPLPISVFLTLGSICLLWAIGRHHSLLFWWPFLILELAQIAGYVEYGSRINSLVLAETFEASGEEALSYLTAGNILLCIAILAGSTLLCLFMYKTLKKEPRLPLLNTGLACALLAAVAGATIPPRYEKAAYIWPLGEAYQLQQACTEALFHNQATIKQVEALHSPTEQPSSLHTLKGGEGVVLVLHVGESVRADRMSINGYERDTTPWLRTQSRLINFPHCISAACDTCQAQIAILTDARRDIYETRPEMLPHTGSVLDLFQAHGFRVYSYFGKRNATHLKYDLVVRLLTRCSDERFHAPGSPWTSVPQMADTLRSLGDKQNTLIFINNEGSHTPFYHYDHENPPFTPADSNFQNPSAHAEEINNAYDATVHYTDEFVRRVTHLLRGRPWIYVYISDHGEYLGHDGIWGRAGLGESKRSYHSTTGCRVGMFIITSPELEQVHPHFREALQTLRNHTSMVVAQEHIFHTLLGFFDLRTPFYDPALDLTSPQATPYTGPGPAEHDTPAGAAD